MAVYVTKSMLSRLGKVKYKCGPSEDPGPSTCEVYCMGVLADSSKPNNLNNSTINLSKEMMCRVCANNGSTPLTEKIEEYEIMSALRTITNVSISEEDSLPKYICTECLNILKLAINFKRTCEASDRKFKQILNPMGDPSFHSYPYSKHDFQLILQQMKLKRQKYEERKRKQLEKIQRPAEKKTQLTKTVRKSKQFRCSPCDLSFPDKESLLSHRRQRQCLRRACELCGQLVLSIGQHMRHIHHQSVPHRCPTCGKEFPVIARLKNHMLVHTDTFNFFCDLCPYKCKHKYYLVMHMRTHTGEKPYKCAHCPATFVNPSNLNKHKLVHQEKQFKCVLCEKAFRTASALREHHEAAHMNIKHHCQYCGRDFCYKSDLRKHEIRSHNRTKRDYIGGEPTYKQVERMQQEQHQEQHQEDQQIDKWRVSTAQDITEGQPVLQVCTATYIDQNKDFIPSGTPIYFTDTHSLTAIIQQPSEIVQPQPTTVQLSLPELTGKKDEDIKLYEAAAQGLGFY